jgi:hypothetical protein
MDMMYICCTRKEVNEMKRTNIYLTRVQMDRLKVLSGVIGMRVSEIVRKFIHRDLAAC